MKFNSIRSSQFRDNPTFPKLGRRVGSIPNSDQDSDMIQDSPRQEDRQDRQTGDDRRGWICKTTSLRRVPTYSTSLPGIIGTNGIIFICSITTVSIKITHRTQRYTFSCISTFKMCSCVTFQCWYNSAVKLQIINWYVGLCGSVMYCF